MDFSGGITAKGVKGSLKANNTFTAKSNRDASVAMGLPPSPPARLDFCSYMPQFDQSLYDVHLDTTSPQYKLNKLCKTCLLYTSSKPVRTTPIANIGEYRMKFRYEYLLDTLPSGRVLYKSPNMDRLIEHNPNFADMPITLAGVHVPDTSSICLLYTSRLMTKK